MFAITLSSVSAFALLLFVHSPPEVICIETQMNQTKLSREHGLILN